jgi:hypothetical protein
MDLLEYISTELCCAQEQVLMLLELYLEEAILVYANISFSRTYSPKHGIYLMMERYLCKLGSVIDAAEKKSSLLGKRGKVQAFKQDVKYLCQKFEDKNFQQLIDDHIVLYDAENNEILHVHEREIIIFNAKQLVMPQSEHRHTVDYTAEFFNLVRVLSLSLFSINQLKFCNSLSGNLIAEHALMLKMFEIKLLSFENVYFTFSGIKRLIAKSRELKVEMVSIHGDTCSVSSDALRPLMQKNALKFSLESSQYGNYSLKFWK